jgi:thiamine biosynthesis protein ThiI
VCLLSDGLDSPVASYMMIKQGFTPIFLSFITSNSNIEKMKDKLIEIARKLSKFSQQKTKMYIISHIPNLELIKRECSRKLTCVLCKRLMIRIAKRIGEIENTNLILTGDILGEQASQTLGNLLSYHSLFKNYIKISPLIGFNKMEVIDINKKIGLYEICSEKIASCDYNPQYPETNAKIDDVLSAENNYDFRRYLKTSLEKAKILEF